MWLVHAGAAAVALLLLVSAGQPLFTEDTWWHLAMGEAYLANGPWLAADPTLHTASGPPAPAAWLSAVTLHGVERAWGFSGLRVLHVLAVAATLGLAWWALRRASASSPLASLTTGLFAALSAYRLFQLRPHLFTIFATLLLVLLLIENGERPTWRRIAAASALLALWANLHGAFPVGLVLLGAASAGLGVACLLWPARRAQDGPRATRLLAALALLLVASFANPSGVEPHLLYFVAGDETPALGVVADEWARVALFRLPVANLPPTPLAWATVWGLLLATPVAVFLAARRGRRVSAAVEGPGVDPALVAVAAVSLVGMLAAVRFLWLGIFPLLVLSRSARALGTTPDRSRRGLAWTTALATALLVPAFARLGDWPMISQGVHRAAYARPYPATKYYAHAVWFLRDARLEGNLFNDYDTGNFLSYWLAPRLRVFVNGSLNVPKHVMTARDTIRQRALKSDESFEDLLDRYGIDVFFGTGEPVMPQENRPEISTTTHLEGTPGWIPVFRNIRSAVYLRANPRNRSNLERVAAWYARDGVPFDPERGFDADRVLREARGWAIAHGLVPTHFDRLERRARSRDPSLRPAAQTQLASVYAALGLYERAAAMDERLLAADPRSVPAARRRLWSLLHQDRGAESLEAAERLAAIAPPGDGLARLLGDAARHRAALPDGRAAAVVALLPVFTRSEGQRLLIGIRQPEARLRGR